MSKVNFFDYKNLMIIHWTFLLLTIHSNKVNIERELFIYYSVQHTNGLIAVEILPDFVVRKWPRM